MNSQRNRIVEALPGTWNSPLEELGFTVGDRFVSRLILRTFAEQFRSMNESEIDEMMACFGKALHDTWAAWSGKRASSDRPAARHGPLHLAMPEQKFAIVTGASRGIGHATALRFHAEGWRVITVSRTPPPPRCPWSGAPSHILLDLSDLDNIVRCIELMRGMLKAVRCMRSSTMPAPLILPRNGSSST